MNIVNGETVYIGQQITHSEFGPYFSFTLLEEEELLMYFVSLYVCFVFLNLRHLFIDHNSLNMQCISTPSLLSSGRIRFLRERGKILKFFLCLLMNFIFWSFLHVFPRQNILSLLCWALFFEVKVLIIWYLWVRHSKPTVPLKCCI